MMIPDHLEKVLFLGAGASIPLGLPRLDSLIEPVVKHAKAGWARQNGRSLADRRLAEYLGLVHGVDADTLDRFLVGERSAMPGIVDILTVLDLAIAENASFGHAPRRNSRGPEPREFSNQELRHVHRTIVGAISDFVSRAKRQRPPEAYSAYRQLTRRFAPHAIITTNWDSMMDRELWNVEDSQRKWKPVTAWVRYTPIGETIFDQSGTMQSPVDAGPIVKTPLLKLHGSLNWLFCPRCQRLIVNAVADLLPIEDEDWMDDDCWCEAVAEPLIITPSFSKSCDNLHIRSIWREALRALARAEQWIFVGYSLPTDDFAVRSLITRALAWKRSEGLPLQAVRIFDWVPDHLKDQASDLAASNAVATATQDADLRRFLELATRYRSILAGSPKEIQFSPEGMLAACEA